MQVLTTATKAPSLGGTTRPRFGLALLLLLLVLLLLFHKSLAPGMTVFSNDGPLGAISANSGALPQGFTGVWLDLNWLGGRGITAPPTLSTMLAWICGPVLFSKIYPGFALLVLGLSSWFFFRQLKLSPLACLLGALASMLNSGAVSIAGWGLPMWAIARAMVFVALALLVTTDRGNRWVNAALAGLAVGMDVSEGFDVGAIFSLLVAAFVVFQSLAQSKGNAKEIAAGGLRLVVVVLFAGLLAAQTVSSLVGTQVQGIAGTEQDQKTREEQWDWATQWSLPKVETLRVIIPGLFGYRMDTPEGGNYWGRVGRQPGWEQHHQGFPRHSGSGEYAGVLVAMLAAWALFQSFRGAKSIFTADQRKFIWFWGGAALICLLFAFGRHAPFYRIIYALPYFSTIRNPIKFMQPFQVALIVLFGFGVHGLVQSYISPARQQLASFGANLKSWWKNASPFERKWTTGLVAFVVISLLGTLVFVSSRSDIARSLSNDGFSLDQAREITGFASKELGWYLFFLLMSAGMVIGFMSGWFAGQRAKIGALLLGAVLVADLVRANEPWILYYDYKEKYASNALIDILREKPYEHRVTVVSFLDPRQIPGLGDLQNIYRVLWAQHHFPFYNIQSLDVTQEPRRPAEKIAFQQAMGNAILRYYELTSTRYIIGLAGLVDPLNQQLDPQKKRFRLHTAFALAQERSDGPILVQTNATGPFALLEFTGALPRAKLYTQWEVQTNDQAVLQQLASPAFDPHQSVFIANNIPNPANNATNATAASVQITDYAPKHITLKSEAPVPTVLLMTDRYDPDWKVWVDGKSETVLRANYLMRALYLPAGNHTIEFRFQPRATALWVSLSALGIGAVLLLLLLVTPGREPERGTDEGARIDNKDVQL